MDSLIELDLGKLNATQKNILCTRVVVNNFVEGARAYDADMTILGYEMMVHGLALVSGRGLSVCREEIQRRISELARNAMAAAEPAGHADQRS